MVQIRPVRVFAAALLALVTSAHITLKDIDSLKSITKDCNEKIRALRSSHNANPAQAVILNDQISKDEIEDVVAGSLTYLDGELLSLLNIPVKDITIEKPDCPEVVKHCHVFLQATTRFLQAIDEKQQEFRWDTDSSIYNALGWMQSLWASRSANEQHLSFIEQQMRLYKASSCFNNVNDVLRQDVEVVEYLNDLMDTF
ncbi:hypothetical protein V490_05480 [Pseudogymnoascus sp. VKM F-3557]|nr:hypothetical protein V490_05480 [Pseudogymnoascus sp. VKM F-3557]